jgi:hypothetical protein
VIRDDHPRHICQTCEEVAEESLRGLLVPPALHQDIENMAILIDGAPQIVTGAVDREEHCIEMPLVARSRTPAAQLVGIGLPELPAPIAHGFVRQHDPAFGHELFNSSIAQAKAEIQPDAVTDDLCWESMALI